MQRRHGDAVRLPQDSGDLRRRLRAFAFDRLDDRLIAEQRIVEGHAAADDRRKGIMTEDDTMSGSLEMHGDRGCDLIGAEDKSERG